MKSWIHKPHTTVAWPTHNFGRAKFFDFERATVFGLGHPHRLPKQKTTRDARNVGGYGHLGHPVVKPMMHSWIFKSLHTWHAKDEFAEFKQ